MSPIVRSLFLLWLVLCVSAGKAYPGEKGSYDFSGYNVILVAFDALQAAHTSCLGYSRNTTPNIDKVAASGFLFSQAIVQASWTVPSFMSIFTSLYPSEHRLVNKYSLYNEKEKVLSSLAQLSPGIETLAGALKNSGYATGGFTGDAGVGGRFGFNRGFDTYVDDQKFAGFEHSIPPAIEWMRKNKDKKFFMFLHGYDSHGQHEPVEGFTRKFLDFDYKGPLKGSKEEQGKLREEGLQKGSIQLTDEDVRFWRALYDEKINDADRRFGEFLGELERLGLSGKTIIIITSDHGTEFYEHKRFDHGFSLYEELIRVPLVIYLPGIKDNKVIREQVRGIDIMPTVLDLLKVETGDKLKEQMRGRSLLPLLKGAHMDLTAFSETDYRLYTHKRSIRKPDGWKFIYTLEDNTKELYDLSKDPQEKNNLVSAESRKAYELEQELFTWLKSMKTEVNSYSGNKEQMIKEY